MPDQRRPEDQAIGRERQRFADEVIMGDKKFIQKAIKKPGALHKELSVPQGKKIPEKKLEAAAKKGGKLGERARFAETLKGMRKK
jgi:hypothetical protein